MRKGLFRRFSFWAVLFYRSHLCLFCESWSNLKKSAAYLLRIFMRGEHPSDQSKPLVAEEWKCPKLQAIDRQGLFQSLTRFLLTTECGLNNILEDASSRILNFTSTSVYRCILFLIKPNVNHSNLVLCSIK